MTNNKNVPVENACDGLQVHVAKAYCQTGREEINKGKQLY